MSKACFSILLTLVFVSAAVVSAEEDSMGTVIGIEGRWSNLDTKRPVILGMHVTKTTVIKRETQGPTSFGTVSVLVKNGARATYSCRDQKSMPAPNVGCMEPLSLAGVEADAERQNASTGSRVFAAIAALMSHGSHEYFSAVSRDAGTAEDVVVELKDGSIDFYPAFGFLNKGDYTIAVHPIQAGNPSERPSMTSKISWDPDKHQMTHAPALAPGLYLLRVTSTDDDAAVGDAWVLVTKPEYFAKKKASYDDVKRTIESWSGAVDSAGVHAVQRATLDALSRGDI